MRPRLLLLLAVLCCGAACQSYVRPRLLDALDMVDLKYACNFNSVGLGAKLEITDYFGIGAGFGTYADVKESYGRYERRSHMDFVHLLLFGADGPPLMEGPRPSQAFHGAGINCCQERRAPVIDRFRVGGELLVFSALGGAYLNFGEMLDFAVGLVGFDLAGDDRLLWDTPLDLGDGDPPDESLEFTGPPRTVDPDPVK